ncbi:DUF11 domain-containing protein, partial [Flavobacterium sp.]|uniref:DUF11 domain-containing protein n=1 Tax=Flavobacterium sp. TaxID=239 RepID=UPI00375260A5
MKTINKYSFIILSLLSIMFTSNSFAEGTPTLSPNAVNITAVLSAPDLASGSYFGCGEDNRIYFNISSIATERLYFGFDWRQYAVGSPPRLTNVYYRIRRPDGSVAVTALWDSTLGSAGSIDTHAKALIGPNIGSTTTGYAPLIFNPTITGEHWIEFYRSNDGGVTALTTNADRAVGVLFDMTVATTAGVKKNGRVHSDKWGFVAVSSTYGNLTTASSEPNFYAYTNDQVVLFIDFRPGFMPIAYDLAVNSYGVTPTGPFNITRRSVNAASAPPLLNGFKVFLNIPDSAVYPVASIPSNPSFLNPALTGCGPYLVRYNTSENGDVRLFFDLNGTPGFQAGTSDRIIEVYGVTAGNNTISWDGLDGLGNVVPDGASMTLTLYFLKGRFNLPIFDAELNKQGFNVQSIAPVVIANSQMYWDDSQLTNVGSVCLTDGTTQDNNFTGSGFNNTITGTASPARAWSSNSNPTQVIPAPANGANETDGITCNDYGNVRVLNTYGWGLATASVSASIFKGCSDLKVVKTVNNASPLVGSNVTFTIDATNLGISNDTNVIVNDILPTGYTLVSATPSFGTWTAPNWNIGTFTGNTTYTLTIVATVNTSGNYSNTACITGTNEDPVSSNNCSTITPIPVQNADLSVVKIASNMSPIIGTNVTFTITATNNGPNDATGVNVNDVIPNGYSIVSVTPSVGSWSSPNWAIGNLSNGSNATLTVVARVLYNGTYSNTACISGTFQDLVSNNNCSTSTPIPVNAVINAVNDSGILINGYIGGTSLTNVLSNDTLNNISVLPSEVTTSFISSTHPGISLSGTDVIVAAGTPAGNYTLTYRICEILNPANCDNAVVTVPVGAPIIDARDDVGTIVNGFTGGTSVTNILANDFLNGNLVIPSQIITLSGTIGFIVFVGLGAGAVAAIVLLVARPWLHVCGAAAGVMAGLVPLILLGGKDFSSENLDFSILSPAWLAVGLIVGGTALFGAALGSVAARLQQTAEDDS